MFNFKAAWDALRSQPQTPAVNTGQTTPPQPDQHDAVKSTFVNWTATLVPFALGILLAISNGYFFAGFHDFSLTDVSTFIAWGSGFAIEAATLAAIFNASLRLKAGDKKGFRASLAVGLALAFISFTAQYVFLQMSLANGSLVVNDSAVDKMPLFSMLVGVNGFQGHDILFLIRSSAYHVAEFSCTFLIASKGMTHEKKLEHQRRNFEYSMAEAQQQMVLDFMKNINENLTQMMSSQQRLMNQQFVQVTEHIERPVPRIEPVTQITAEIDARQIAAALDEQSKKAKALWTPQPQPESQNQGPANE
ncbi:hypothetical protein [Ktedonobacter robiniae]|uniref:Uncharacterized protein n=1 Tax=Ktedonobacter robiniae TaxID=2778365 RepID=A0ABQ3US06_9CHLR|nr:hypothetical protein [Ktedonobacter robiniae]GHO55511.1 hypothetical protein KSB_39860 [Ktedonobacter robiniae]